VIGEFDFDGVFVSPLLIYAIVALAICAVVQRLLILVGFYRLVWHRALFDFALFVVLLGAVSAVAGPLIERGGWR
jgi:hypothetical protein